MLKYPPTLLRGQGSSFDGFYVSLQTLTVSASSFFVCYVFKVEEAVFYSLGPPSFHIPYLFACQVKTRKLDLSNNCASTPGFKGTSSVQFIVLP